MWRERVVSPAVTCEKSSCCKNGEERRRASPQEGNLTCKAIKQSTVRTAILEKVSGEEIFNTLTVVGEICLVLLLAVAKKGLPAAAPVLTDEKSPTPPEKERTPPRGTRPDR